MFCLAFCQALDAGRGGEIDLVEDIGGGHGGYSTRTEAGPYLLMAARNMTEDEQAEVLAAFSEANVSQINAEENA